MPKMSRNKKLMGLLILFVSSGFGPSFNGDSPACKPTQNTIGIITVWMSDAMLANHTTAHATGERDTRVMNKHHQRHATFLVFKMLITPAGCALLPCRCQMPTCQLHALLPFLICLITILNSCLPVCFVSSQRSPPVVSPLSQSIP